jgi:hypothetical protein
MIVNLYRQATGQGTLFVPSLITEEGYFIFNGGCEDPHPNDFTIVVPGKSLTSSRFPGSASTFSNIGC